MLRPRSVLAFVLLVLLPAAVSYLVYFVNKLSGVTALVVGALSSFALCDMWYFLRIGMTSLPLGPKRGPRCHLFATNSVTGFVGLTDIDRNGHCNNARVLRECGFGRRELWHRNGVWDVVVKSGGNFVVGAQTVRYRRELSFGQVYTMQSRLICWDARAFYIEQRFVTKDTSRNGFVNAIVLVKNTVVGALSPEQIVSKLPALEANEETNPAMPADISAWIQSNDASSRMIRSEAAT
uniref:Thioesterase n=1 Tax=Peronospora matthiolae TaxID=2874970 RepID=A0AAV1UZV4_9STRA